MKILLNLSNMIIMRVKKDKILIISLMLISIIYNFNNVYAFEFPTITNKNHVQDIAEILPISLQEHVETRFDDYFNNKNLQGSLITIKESVGDKKVYTEQIKEWWGIGKKDNGFVIALYPNSKDNVEIIIDESLKKYISQYDIENYKYIIKDGFKNSKLEENLSFIIEDLDNKLKDYSNKDVVMQSIKEFFNTFLFTMKPKSTVLSTFLGIKDLSNSVIDIK